jgi:hypothetical protein
MNTSILEQLDRDPNWEWSNVNSDLNLNEDLIKSWAQEYKAKHGKYPSSLSKEVEMIPDCFKIRGWRALDSSLRVGGRGLSGGSSLVFLLGGNRVKQKNLLVGEELVQELKKSLLNFKEKEGKFPSRYLSGSFLSDGSTLKSIDRAFQRRNRGLDKIGCKTLSDFMRKEFGEGPTGIILKIDDVKKEIREYIRIGKERLTRNSVDFALFDGTSAENLRGLLKSGSRGLPKGSSLSKLVDEVESEMRQAGELPEGYVGKGEKKEKTARKTDSSLDKKEEKTQTDFSQLIESVYETLGSINNS